jgi:subtilisin family serine protease
VTNGSHILNMGNDMGYRKSHVAWGLVLVLSGSSACSRGPKKFNFDYPHKEQELIVTVRPNLDVADLTSLASPMAGLLGGEALAHGVYLVRIAQGTDLEDAAERLSSMADVETVEANQVYRLDAVIPNDPDFVRLYGLKNSGQAGGLSGADIAAPDAWETTTGSSAVVVGIIDSGVDYNHPDLAANIWSNPGESGLDANGRDKSSNGVDDDANGFVDDVRGWDFFNNDNNPMDDNSHGTHVAGTIGAVGNNGIGVAGVNWTVRMVPIKVFSGAGESTSDVLIRGIDYASSLGVGMTNNSWGGGGFSDAMLTAIQRAADKDVLFLAAAGNNGSNNDQTPHYPSSYNVPNVIAVAASNRSDRLASFSNYGSGTVHVAAPGEDIYSTVPNRGYGSKSGTSMATPHVTGLAALIKARYPEIKGADIKQKIILSALPVPSLAAGVRFGRIDARSAIEEDTIAPSAVVAVEVEEAGVRNLRLSWQEAGDDRDEGQASRYFVRYAKEPIIDEASWQAARPLLSSGETLRREGRVITLIEGLEYNLSGYVAVRAQDNVGNIGPLSSSVAFTLQAIAVLVQEENDTRDGWGNLNAPWDIRREGDLGVLSDSPLGKYDNNVDASATTQMITIADNDVVLDIRSKWQLENAYDYAYIEISKDRGVSWQELRSFSGSSNGWQVLSLPLQSALGSARSFQIRFRLKTDFSVTYDGWDIDSYQIVGRQR